MKKDGEGDGLVAVTGGATVVDARGRAEAKAASEQLRKRVLSLRDQMGEAYFEMGRLLHRINKDGLYTHWRGPDGRPYQQFRDYVEHEVDFHFRKAKHLMSIWWWFAEELGDKVVMEKIKEIGWTKAALLVGVVDGKNVDVWVSKAKQLGIKELGEETRVAMEVAQVSRRPARSSSGSSAIDARGKTVLSEPSGLSGLESTGLPLPMPEDASANADRAESRMGVDPLSDDALRDYRTRWTILMTGEQRVNVERAIDMASGIAEIEADGKGFLLDLVATNFLAAYAGTVGNNDREHKINFRNEILRGVERALGVDLVAVDRGTYDPLYGLQVLERLASMEDARASKS